MSESCTHLSALRPGTGAGKAYRAGQGDPRDDPNEDNITVSPMALFEVHRELSERSFLRNQTFGRT